MGGGHIFGGHCARFPAKRFYRACCRAGRRRWRRRFPRRGAGARTTPTGTAALPFRLRIPTYAFARGMRITLRTAARGTTSTVAPWACRVTLAARVQGGRRRAAAAAADRQTAKVAVVSGSGCAAASGNRGRHAGHLSCLRVTSRLRAARRARRQQLASRRGRTTYALRTLRATRSWYCQITTARAGAGARASGGRRACGRGRRAGSRRLQPARRRPAAVPHTAPACGRGAAPLRSQATLPPAMLTCLSPGWEEHRRRRSPACSPPPPFC